eukprot:GEZU01042766.1.p1 GENE.GEZU01042766.1~~GEZU01042766.1.p1  ORF type:complete len:248 (-),score=58.61 GEZU01042766.1:110-757(-)
MNKEKEPSFTQSRQKSNVSTSEKMTSSVRKPIPTSETYVHDKDLKAHHIVPTLIDDFKPEQDLNVSLASKLLSFGEHISPGLMVHPPYVQWLAGNNELYTLLMIDSNGNFCHWLVTNIPSMDIFKGDQIMQWMGPRPQKGSGTHRYVFLLFRQPGKIDFPAEFKQSLSQIDKRRGFDVKKWVKGLGLTPIAINMFLAEFDPRFPKLTVSAQAASV